MEAFGAGDYFWIPFQDVAVLELDPPKRLRDLLWAPVRLRTGPNFKNKDLGEVLMPVIAPLSWQHADDAVKLGRVSEWCADEAGEEAPFGQKMLLVDGEEFPYPGYPEIGDFSPRAARLISSCPFGKTYYNRFRETTLPARICTTPHFSTKSKKPGARSQAAPWAPGSGKSRPPIIC